MVGEGVLLVENDRIHEVVRRESRPTVGQILFDAGEGQTAVDDVTEAANGGARVAAD